MSLKSYVIINDLRLFKETPVAARHNFRKLSIWKDGIEIVKETYLTTKTFPKSEVYLETALGSAFEWETQLIMSYEVGYISEHTFKHLERKIQILQGMITRFMESLGKS